ncbi:hypothetical protein GII30_08140 [Gordonia amarae]|nr:hypothetical protein [Gordonia amarae]MCS3878351.1 hypothetical protein [Gordonia amarae]QHN16994.1 hypothetical protein GII35_08365 [Gordonia amarae]QHN21520.1 hypothetical protein GII34_08145 [Gordonia amarae]QHN30370.1 hypothetical protein GII32_08155 [Gordonia amarae]QHN39147.1 hypothetical protein GII30_08140 [Gordonia amarae]
MTIVRNSIIAGAVGLGLALSPVMADSPASAEPVVNGGEGCVAPIFTDPTAACYEDPLYFFGSILSSAASGSASGKLPDFTFSFDNLKFES